MRNIISLIRYILSLYIIITIRLSCPCFIGSRIYRLSGALKKCIILHFADKIYFTYSQIICLYQYLLNNLSYCYSMQEADQILYKCQPEEVVVKSVGL